MVLARFIKQSLNEEKQPLAKHVLEKNTMYKGKPIPCFGRNSTNEKEAWISDTTLLVTIIVSCAAVSFTRLQTVDSEDDNKSARIARYFVCL